MTYQEFVQAAIDNYVLSGTYRVGQAYMNALCFMRYDLYNKIVCSEIDAYYDDTRVPALLTYLELVW